jgi:hypothetical protein
MTQFLQNMKDPNSDQQQRMQEVLLGGRGQQKRLYAVDDAIYGTEEGAKLQKEAVEGSSGKIIKKKRKKRKNKEKEDDSSNSSDDMNDKGTTNNNNVTTTDSNVRLKQSVAGVVIVGTLAAGVSMFLGGGKRSQ